MTADKASATAAALSELRDRMRQADRELRDLALSAIGTTARDRLVHKADGVRLALSYVEEAIRGAGRINPTVPMEVRSK